MKCKFAIINSLLACFLCASASAEVNLRLRAGYAVSGDYSVKSDVTFTGTTRLANGQLARLPARPLAYDVDYKAVPLGATVIFGNGLYMDLAYQASSGEADFAWAPTQAPDFSRDETTFTVGSRYKNFSAYVGYKMGTTETDWPRGYEPDKFETNGLVFGAGYVIPISKSAINFGLGIGRLQGEYTYATGSSDKTDATFGYTLAVGYTYSFNKHISLAADYKWTSYDYEWTNQSIQEELKQTTVTAAYSF